MPKNYLADTPFADKADCIALRLRRHNMHTYPRWENAPVTFGSTICGEDVYQVIAALNAAAAAKIDHVPELAAEEEGIVEEAEPEEGGSIFHLTHRGISENQAQILASAGFMTIEQLKDAGSRDQLKKLLTDLEGIGEKTAEKVLAAIK